MAKGKRARGPSLGYVVFLPDGRVVCGFCYPPRGQEINAGLFPKSVRLSEGCWAMVREWGEDGRPFLWLGDGGEQAAAYVAGGIGGHVVIIDRDRDGPWGPVSGCGGVARRG